MAKRTTATSVDYFSRDDTGAMVGLNYECPHCHYSTGELIFVGTSGLGALDSGFETDQVCGVCDGEVTIEVPASLY
jgi:hypothetical protein